MNLGEEGESGSLVGDGTSDGDEFALLDFSLECYSLFDSRVRTRAAAAAVSSDHGSLGSGGGENEE